MSPIKSYDAIVVGAGHAGTEASLAIARAGFRVLFLTMNTETICQMSCNPAIGGLAKGHVVREIDALGGQMALTIDQTGIQFRMLNQSKGPAVWAPRAQADKKQYQTLMKKIVEREPNIELKQDQVVELLVDDGKATGVKTKSGTEYFAKTVVITTGTFMRGLIHVGDENYPGGRGGEPPSIGLSDSLTKHGIEMVRFKTGTPPRLRKNTIDFSACEEQKGDENPQPFSYRTDRITQKQLSCYLTYTNQKTHDAIKANLHRSPLYGGIIKGIGPRYCPSIEDKVVRFADKERHQIYLEPEGWESEEIYVNGISTSLPKDVQEDVVHSIRGLEHAEIMKYGYAIEYDCAPPTQLKHTLETKKIENLFFAGQINCTSGYEEAAGQGIVAGFNVIRKLKNEPPFILNRSESYIGVMIDDLVTLGTNEPYRLFTSRSEFRLLLRQDNADERLMQYGYEFGLIPKSTYEIMEKKSETVKKAIEILRTFRIENTTADKILKRRGENLKSLAGNSLHSLDINENIEKRIEYDIKYEGYVSRQLIEIEKFKKMEKRKIPDSIDYNLIKGIGREAKEKLQKIKPQSLGQASRIPGISPCDITVISILIEKMSK